ncbi:MAG: lysine--tRNA ligase [Verrucomicrobia bacterium]|nr:lysine--tRNA ligase [Verrucomicrobiota bacterium]
MQEHHDLISLRKEKLASLRAKGIDPFRNEFHPAESVAMARENPAEGRSVKLAGRMTAHRDMGKSMFCDLRDETDRIQIYAQKNTLGDAAFEIFKHLDLGDILGVEGELFTTKTGELTVKIRSFTILAKALRPPPEKWHGLQDVEIRYRQRYLDLMANVDVRSLFRNRSRIIQEIRNFLNGRGYIEVETPMLQSVAGGAAAKPFVTHHDALGCDLYLRIAIELYLKRLLVGGFEKIYEINRNFRNEGISRRHNPEFTMLELYHAYGNYATMMELAEEMIPTVARKVFGTLDIAHHLSHGAPSKVIHLEPPWERKTFWELLGTAIAPDFRLWPLEKKRAKALELDIKEAAHMEEFDVANQIFEKIVQPSLIQPVFVTHLPQELVPLAKISKDDPETVEVFELCINGMEIAPAYSEQNDPIEQRKRFLEQTGHPANAGQKLDEDFLAALEHGMPPAGGIGIGIDRLVMTLTGAESIRDVIFFPQLKPLETVLSPVSVQEPGSY